MGDLRDDDVNYARRRWGETEAELIAMTKRAEAAEARVASLEAELANATSPDHDKYYVKARVYGAIAARYREALDDIVKTGPLTRDGSGAKARAALDWRVSPPNNGVPVSALEEMDRLLGADAENAALRERVASYEAKLRADSSLMNKANEALHHMTKLYAAEGEKLAVAEANLVASAEAQQRITDDATRLAEHMGKRIGIAVAALREISHISRYNDSGEWVDVADEALKKLGVE